ncbi:hypothetical protein M3Y97_00939700 [Aphelenchoides bicaudatus]|nr:hypothetical protein M3Y97_00939700 [Aphelenchoides bicaudatus]
MSYGSNYYDYQIAVVFAILIVALLILGAFVLGIYYIFVVQVRNKKQAQTGARTRTPSSIPATRPTGWQVSQPQPLQPATPYSPEFQRPQDYGYDPRLNQQVGYPQQQPLVQQQGYGIGVDYPGVKVRELQPEYVYQQGPVTWTTNQPVHETYPVTSPIQQTAAGAYHMSSV